MIAQPLDDVEAMREADRNLRTRQRRRLILFYLLAIGAIVVLMAIAIWVL